MGSCFLVLSACAGGISVGLPLFMMVAPLLGSAGFALFYDSGMLRDYFMFCAGTLTSLGWLLWHHFWFLEITVGSISLHIICQLIGVSGVVALVVPGLLLTDSFDTLTTRGLEAFLCLQAICVTLLEERLFAGEHDEDAAIYPAYLILFTSIAGYWFSKKSAIFPQSHLLLDQRDLV